MVRVTELGARLRTQVVTREISATHRLHWNKNSSCCSLPQAAQTGASGGGGGASTPHPLLWQGNRLQKREGVVGVGFRSTCCPGLLSRPCCCCPGGPLWGGCCCIACNLSAVGVLLRRPCVRTDVGFGRRRRARELRGVLARRRRTWVREALDMWSRGFGFRASGTAGVRKRNARRPVCARANVGYERESCGSPDGVVLAAPAARKTKRRKCARWLARAHPYGEWVNSQKSSVFSHSTALLERKCRGKQLGGVWLALCTVFEQAGKPTGPYESPAR